MKTMNKKRVFIVASVLSIVTMSGVAFAATRPTEVGAGEKPPIVKTVENHEERISNAETRLDDVQTQTNQNSNDIQDLDKRVSSVSQNTRGGETKVVERVQTVVEKPAPLTEGDYPITPNNPAPVPVDPWTITNIVMTLENQTHIRPKQHLMVCSFTFSSGKTFTTRHTTYLDENGNVNNTTSKPDCNDQVVGTVMTPQMRKALGFE